MDLDNFYWLDFWPLFTREGEGKGRLVDIRLIFFNRKGTSFDDGKARGKD